MENPQDRTVTIRFVLGRRELVGALVAALVLVNPGGLATEQLTMTTYYPSPYGVYQRLRSTQDAYLATDTSASPQRRVGIGTAAPARKLDVAGDMQASDMYTTDGVQIQGLSGRNYFRDTEGAGNLRVGAAWGMPGVYAESGVGVLGGASGASLQNNTLFATTNGRVGVGRTDPGYRLDVNGDARVTGVIREMCRVVYFAPSSTTPCPTGWAATGFLRINTREVPRTGSAGSPTPGAWMETVPYDGFISCCKLTPNG